MSIFKKAEKVSSAGKFLAFGATGSGKTTFSLTFPDAFAFDSEQGMNFYLDNPNLLQVAPTASIYDMQEGIDELEELLNDDSNAVGTVIFDSETKFYQNIQDISLTVEEKRAKEKGRDVDDTNLSVRSWGRIKSVSNRLQNMKIDLSSRGVNIVSTAHEAEIKKKVGDEYVVVGHKPDTYKNLPFDYDIVLRMIAEEDEASGETKYFAKVLKDRTGTFSKGEKIENPSYEMWEQNFDTNSDTEQTDYSGDTDGDIKKMMDEEDESDKVSNLVKALKTAIKKADQDKKLEVAKVLKDNGTSIKGLSALSLEKLREIRDDVVEVLSEDSE